MTRHVHPYTVTSTTPTPAEAATRLRNLALNAGDDASRGIGSGAWLIERSHDSKVFNMAADALERSVSASTMKCHTLGQVWGHADTLDTLGYKYRITSGVDVSDEFYQGTGWLVEVLDGPETEKAA